MGLDASIGEGLSKGCYGDPRDEKTLPSQEVFLCRTLA